MGHLNIRSVASKTEQLVTNLQLTGYEQPVLTNSTFNLLCFSETWLTESSRTLHTWSRDIKSSKRIENLENMVDY